MKNNKVKVFRTIEAHDSYLVANNFRPSGCMILEVADQIIGGRSLYGLLQNKKLKPVELVNQNGIKEEVLKCTDVKRIALELML